MAITRHDDTVGYYIPAQRKRAETSERVSKKPPLVCSKCSLQNVSLRKRSRQTSDAGTLVSVSDGSFLSRVAVTKNAHFAGFNPPFCEARKCMFLNTYGLRLHLREMRNTMYIRNMRSRPNQCM